MQQSYHKNTDNFIKCIITTKSEVHFKLHRQSKPKNFQLQKKRSDEASQTTTNARHLFFLILTVQTQYQSENRHDKPHRKFLSLPCKTKEVKNDV